MKIFRKSLKLVSAMLTAAFIFSVVASIPVKPFTVMAVSENIQPGTDSYSDNGFEISQNIDNFNHSQLVLSSEDDYIHFDNTQLNKGTRKEPSHLINTDGTADNIYEGREVPETVIQDRNIRSHKVAVFGNDQSQVEFTLPYTETKSKFTLYTGAWQASRDITVLLNGTEILKTNPFGAKSSNTAYHVYALTYKLKSQSDKLVVRMKMLERYNSTWGNFNVMASALESLPEDIISSSDLVKSSYRSANQDENLTLQGRFDWVKFTGSLENYEMKKI